MRKTALITGASSGIGWETALLLATEYKYTVIALSRNSRQLELLKKKAALSEGNVLVLPYDLLEEDFNPVREFLKKNKISALDLLINNAGLLIKKPFETMKRIDLIQTYSVNAFSPFLLTQKLLPLLKKSGEAHVVNISSIGGYQGAAKFPGLSAYSSSKAALACMTECLAEELKTWKISVNCLCLGSVATEMLQEAFPGYKAPINAVAMGRFIARFAAESHLVMNGKVLPVSIATP